MKTTTHVAALLGLITFVAAAPALAQQQPETSAPPAQSPAAEQPLLPLAESLHGLPKADYISGRVLFEDGDFASSLIKFQNAFDASKDPRLLWNIAACEKALRRYARVLKLLERYVKEGGALITEQDKLDAGSVVDAVQPLVSRLSVESTPPGAEVSADAERLGVTPLSNLLIDIGNRKITLRLAGFEDFVAPTIVKGGEDLKVSGQLKKILHEGSVTVQTKPGQVITIDGRGLGDGHWTGILPSGPHTLRVTATGYRTYQSEISVRDHSSRTIQVELEKEASAGVPAWVWVAGGIVVASGVTVGGFLLFSKEETTPAQYYRGNLAPGTVYLP